jgi:hypothetical protein
MPPLFVGFRTHLQDQMAALGHVGVVYKRASFNGWPLSVADWI